MRVPKLVLMIAPRDWFRQLFEEKLGSLTARLSAERRAEATTSAASAAASAALRQLSSGSEVGMNALSDMIAELERVTLER